MALEGSSGKTLVQAESYFEAKASLYDLLDIGYRMPDAGCQNLRGFLKKSKPRRFDAGCRLFVEEFSLQKK